MAKWLDKYEQGGMVLKQKTKDNYGKRENANEGHSTAGPGWIGEGYSTTGRDYSPAWGGSFAAMGTSIPGSTGMMYARTINPAPANGKYTKKTLASAQAGRKLIDWGEAYNSGPEMKNIYEGDVTFFNPKDFEGVRGKVEN